MSTDSFKRVFFNDGEGITHGDLNDSQTFLETRLSDQILHALIGNVSLSGTDPEFGGKNGANAPTHLAYCLHGGSAYLRQGTGNAKLQIAPGVLMQKTGSMDGSTPTLLAYTFAGTEEVTIANGDVTNPRVDILQMKLELVSADTQSRDFEDATTHLVTTTTPSKKKRVQCTLSVKQGTPGASPVYPDPDTGYVCVAGVLVGTSYVAAAGMIFDFDETGAVAVVHDQRMPLNVQEYFVAPNCVNVVTNASVTTNNWAVATSNATNDFRFQCPKGGAGRVVGVVFNLDAGPVNPGTVNLVSHGTSDYSIPHILNMVDDDTDGTLGAAFCVAKYYEFEQNHTPEAGGGPTIQASATNKIGPPVWTSGTRCAMPASTRAMPRETRVALQFKNLAHISIVWNVGFYIAQGL